MKCTRRYIVIDNEGEGVIAQVSRKDKAIKIAINQERKTHRNQTVAREVCW